MKVCKNCGKQTEDDNATICDTCGGNLTKEVYKNPPVYKPTQNRKTNTQNDFQQFDFEGGHRSSYNSRSNYDNRSYYDNRNSYDSRNYYSYPRRDEGGLGWILLGLLLSPIVALAFYFLLKDDYPNRMRDIAKGAIIGIVVCIVLVAFVYCGAIALLANNSYYR